jgi:hypothetical protein
VKARLLALISLFTLTLAIPMAPAQTGATEQSLRTAHETLMGALKSGNLVMVQALIHPQALGFFRDGQRLAQLGGSYGAAEALPAVLTDLGQFQVVPYEATYRVSESTGIVCLSASMQAKEKSKSRVIRATYVYVVTGGNWKLLSWHTSDVPLQK